MVSVCMASYNGAKYIAPQIDSILAQLDAGDELIISDDGSTDGTQDIINAYQDERIVLLRHVQSGETAAKDHAGIRLAAANFENALKHARGEYIFLSDQDDLWVEGRKKECLNYLRDYDMVSCNCSIINEQDKTLIEKVMKKAPLSKSLVLNIINAGFPGCCAAFNKKVLRYVLPFPEDLFLHDLWIGCVGNACGKYHFIDTVLHQYRRYTDNISQFQRSNNSLFFKIAYRVQMFAQIVKRIRQINREHPA